MLSTGRDNIMVITENGFGDNNVYISPHTNILEKGMNQSFPLSYT